MGWYGGISSRGGSFPSESAHGTPILSLGEERAIEDVFDATTGQVLKGKLVQQARAEEMDYFETKNVYTKVPRAEALESWQATHQG